MNINHHNYEEYFILYMDNELSIEERRRVEAFATQYPELKEELNILLQSKITADNKIVFENKNELLKNSQVPAINVSNIEEWLILYHDNELSSKEISSVETFISQNPQLKKELEYFGKIKLQPETDIIFPDKQSLYRKEEKVPVIPFRWWKIAAAAVLLLAIGLTVFILTNKQQPATEPGNKLATQSNQSSTNDSLNIKNAKNLTQKNKEALVVVDNKNAIATKASKQDVIDNRIQKEKKVLPTMNLKDEKQLASTQIKPSNNLPLPDINVTRPENLKDVTNVIKNEKNLTPQNKPDLPVTTPATGSYITYTAANQKQTGDIINTGDNDESKNKLRGLFRKVTRIFERNTHINATDDDNRLLIGGLSVKLN